MEEKPSFEIKEGEFEGKNYLAKKYTNLAHEKITPDFFEQNYKAISKQKADFGNGAPSAIFYTWDTLNLTTDIAIAIPIKELPPKISDNFEIINISKNKCFFIDYYGSYADMEPAHTTLSHFINSNNISGKFLAIEEYVTDPAAEPNPKKWLTKISYVKL